MTLDHQLQLDGLEVAAVRCGHGFPYATPVEFSMVAQARPIHLTRRCLACGALARTGHGGLRHRDLGEHLVAIVSCGSAKLGRAAIASELFTSTLFRLNMRFASLVADQVWILSAKHGLISPNTPLEPYDLRLEELDARGRDGVHRSILNRLSVACATLGAPRCPVLVRGVAYLEAVRSVLPEPRILHWRHAQLFQRMRELALQLELARSTDDWLEREIPGLGSRRKAIA